MVAPQYNPGNHSQNRILQADYDYVLAGQDRECEYCLTDGQVRWILAMLEYAGWRTRWVADSGEIDTVWIVDFKGDLARRLMSGCQENTPQETRWTDDGEWQVKNPITDEWETRPDLDPRLAAPEPPMLPGEPSSAKQCAGADNVETAFKDIRDRLIDVLSGSVVFLIIVDFFIGIFAAWLFSTVLGSVVAVMIWSLATALLSMTPESVAEQLTDAVMDEFKCLVFCRLNDDGQLTYETWVQLMADIDDHFTGFPETFFHGIVAALGYNGINAMCSAGAATAEDCDECECGEWCYYWDFSIDDGSWSPEWGFYNTGCCWEGVDLGGGNMSLFAKKTGVGHLTKVEAYYSFGTMGDCDFFVDDVSVGGILNQFSGIKTWNVDIDITTDVGFNPSSGASYGAGNSVECLWVKLTGTGANPFGENNCP